MPSYVGSKGLRPVSNPVGMYPGEVWSNFGGIVNTKALVILIVVVTFLPRSGYAALVDLIPGLYGGDGITMAPPSGPFPSHAAHFTVDSAAQINQLNQNISTQVATFPFSSFAGGFTFEFDPALGTFVKTTESSGPFFAERANTLGAGRFNVQASYTFFKYDTFEGTGLDSLGARALHEPDVLPPPDQRTSFELDEILLDVDVDLKVQILALSTTYGINERLDVGILLPVVKVDMRVDSRASVAVSPSNPFPTAHQFGPEAPDDSASDSATGLGDVLLRAKYQWLKGDAGNLAAALLVKTQTGDERDFLGTGDVTVRPFLAYSRSLGTLTPHVNLGYEVNLDDHRKNSVEYVVGFDYLLSKVTLAADLIGSHELDGDGVGDRIVSGAFGAKWAVLKDWVLSANALIPLNDSGLRSDLIASIGVQHAF